MGVFDDKDIAAMGIEVGSEAFTLMRDSDLSASEAVMRVLGEREYTEPGIVAFSHDTEFLQAAHKGVELSRYLLERD